jgi:2-polyprenyl-3-methyl-5-hydroxy-6-metoxy-1,4-benzoquinol methylase
MFFAAESGIFDTMQIKAETEVPAGFATLAERKRQPELMDQPGLDEGLHAGALRSLSRINWFSRTSSIIWEPIRGLAREARPSRPIRILDVACGGGDVAMRLSRLAEREGLSAHVDGCDINPVAVKHARSQAMRRKVSNVSFFVHDALHSWLPTGYDVISCSLFLHHLEERDAELMLRAMASAAGRMVVASDLRRSRLGYVLAWASCRVLTRSPIVRVDGPLSVAAAFTMGEARELAARAGLAGATLSCRWPQRFLLVWKKPP